MKNIRTSNTKTNMPPNMPRHLSFVLRELCKRVKADYKKINFSEPDWFMQKSWTEQEQEKFRLWFVKQLESKTEMRRLMEIPLKQNIEKFASFFCLMYGWKIKETVPNPGSDEAVNAGCTCARIDNGYGNPNECEYGKGHWVISSDCKLHGGTK
jgi:hypothetical protein